MVDIGRHDEEMRRVLDVGWDRIDGFDQIIGRCTEPGRGDSARMSPRDMIAYNGSVACVCTIFLIFKFTGMIRFSWRTCVITPHGDESHSRASFI